MDFTSSVHKSQPHQRTIIHLDMDYFYAQVEEIRDPTLRCQPVGVQQKNIVVTCNYNARAMGVKKLMLVTVAKVLCPELVLVNGEDLTPYRQISQKIFDILLNYTSLVEKLGFDENFIDVSSLVESREQQQYKMQQYCDGVNEPLVAGHIYPSDGTTLNACSCGCANRLALGTQIAKEIRHDLKSKLEITCCAGVSYNKLLAKLVGSQYKPNQQTVLVSSHAEQFMRELTDLNRITGIGQKTTHLLFESGVTNIEQLQNCEMDFLKKKFGYETATKLKDLAFGRDSGAVRTTGKPKSISLEDSCKPISVRNDVEDRFRLLLRRLMEQVADDGRIPICIKVVLRKFDTQKKTSHRETKQANILPSLFKTSSCTDTGGPKVMLADGAQEKLLKIIMRLFERVVDLSKPFNITLIGLAFSKFQQRKVGSSSIASFLIKKTDLEVQSITSLTNTDFDVSTDYVLNAACSSQASKNGDEAFRSSPTTFQPSDQFYRRRTTAASPIPMLLDNGSESGATNSDFSDFSETEIEPSPKKSRISRLILNKRRCFGTSAIHGSACDTPSDVASPSKLRVCDLRLNSRDSDRDFTLHSSCIKSSNNGNVSSNNTASSTSSTEDFRLNAANFSHQHSLRPSKNSSFVGTPMDDFSDQTEMKETKKTFKNASHSPDPLPNIPCPAGVDPDVFNELPVDVQSELIASWRSSLAAAAAAVASSTNPSNFAQTPASSSSTAKIMGSVNNNKSQKNTLYRYFLRNK